MSNRLRTNLKTWSRRTVILIAFVVALVWLAQAFVLPGLIKSAVVRQLASMGYPSATLEVDHVSLTSTTLRNLHSPAGLDARLVHVTYTPSSLFAGRVGDIAVKDVFARAQAYRPTPGGAASSSPSSSPATRPPFERLSIENATVEIPTPTGPATAQVRVGAVEQEDHRLAATIDVSIPGLRLQGTLDADPDFAVSKVTARIDADLAALPGMLGRQDMTVTGQVHVQAAGEVQRGETLKWNLARVDVDGHIPTASAPGTEIVDARVSIHAKASGTDGAFAADLLPESKITAAKVQSGTRIPPFGVALRPRDVAVSREGETWNIRTEGADVELGDVQFAFNRGQLQIDNRRVRGRIESSLDLGQMGKSRLLQGVFPVLGKMQLGGKVELLFVRAAAAGTSGEDLPSLTLRILDGTVGSQEYALTAEGIESEVVFVGLTNPHTLSGQQLKMRYGQMGKWEVRDALFQFAMPDLNTLDVERTELGWLGGMVWADAFQVKFDSPIIRSRVYGNGLDLGKLIWIATAEKAWAEGLVDLEIPLAFRWPRMRFGDGFIEARPGGKLHLDFVAEKLGGYLIATDPRFMTDPTYSLVRERVVKALREFRYSKLRMGMKRGEQHLDTIVQIAGKGDYEGGQEVNLNLTVGDLDWLISRYLAMPKTQMTTE